jgi:hypothetical protein
MGLIHIPSGTNHKPDSLKKKSQLWKRFWNKSHRHPWMSIMRINPRKWFRYMETSLDRHHNLRPVSQMMHLNRKGLAKVLSKDRILQ